MSSRAFFVVNIQGGFFEPGIVSQGDPYGGKGYAIYKSILDLALRFRKSVIVLMVVLLAFSVYGFGHVKKAFFTSSNTPIFYVDL